MYTSQFPLTNNRQVNTVWMKFRPKGLTREVQTCRSNCAEEALLGWRPKSKMAVDMSQVFSVKVAQKRIYLGEYHFNETNNVKLGCILTV